MQLIKLPKVGNLADHVKDDGKEYETPIITTSVFELVRERLLEED